jgi:predicted DNA-binding helix-hairpin-helix protein
MDSEQKLELLAPAARFEICDGETRAGKKPPRAGATPPPGLFRVLMSSRCAWNCAYCPLRAGNDGPRARLEPEELARGYMARAERNATSGLFLSSAVDESVDRAMEQMLDAVEILRQRHGYTGYVHLKLLPGTSYGDVERASRLADRLSLNLEAPNAERLARIAPQRSYAGDLLRLSWARDFGRGERAAAPRRAGQGGLASGLATQLVVGAAGESDREIVAASAQLYGQLGLRRVYFGAFRPAVGTPLAEAAPTPLSREQRLGQADWLLRHYGFADGELPFGPDGNLPLGVDPKLAWALAHPELFPVEINRADPELLLRVPGVGPIALRRILRLRAQGSFREPAQLKGTGARVDAARDFLSFDGRFFGRPQALLARHYLRPAPVEAEQLSLW